jgi:hypothetical protein
MKKTPKIVPCCKGFSPVVLETAFADLNGHEIDCYCCGRMMWVPGKEGNVVAEWNHQLKKEN